MLKIGMCFGRVKLNSSDIAKVKRSKVKITKSNENRAQKHDIYAGNVIG